MKEQIIEFLEWMRDQEDGNEHWDEPEFLVDRYIDELTNEN